MCRDGRLSKCCINFLEHAKAKTTEKKIHRSRLFWRLKTFYKKMCTDLKMKAEKKIVDCDADVQA